MSTTPPLRVVEADIAGELERGNERPHIPEGEYRAVYVRHEVAEMRKFGNEPKLFLWLRIVDPGAHFGVELYRAYRIAKIVGKSRFTLRKDSELVHMLATVLQLRRRPDRISLRELAGKVLVVRIGSVRHVTRNRQRVELPEWLRYSVVREVLRAETS
jgi:hypothetical protein